MLARLPPRLVRALAVTLGDVVFVGLPRRRRLVLSNLHHAFPEKSADWRRRIGRESCHRLIETGLLSLAMPFLSDRRLRAMLRIAPDLQAALAAHRADAPPPTLFATPHLCYWEILTAMPLVVPSPFPEFGVIFRPLDHPAADAWVKRTRERFGMRLLSRKEGFHAAMQILRRRGCVGLLFDQNAGFQGALSTLFGRVCSTSELAGLLAEKFTADVYALYSRRRGCWQIEMAAHAVAHDGTAAGIILGLNRWLEGHLADDDACASWLWAHDRWRNQDIPTRRLRLEAKRSLLDVELRQRGLSTLPRRTRLWIRLPNWLGDVIMAVPLLRALRASRPDAQLTLLVRAPFRELLEGFGVADRTLVLPPRGWGYFRHFRRLRAEYPDCYLLFTNSLRGDLEAWNTGCRQRFGLVPRGRLRPLLTHAWRPSSDQDLRCQHQLRTWEDFLRHFGLATPPDLAPLGIPSPGLRSAPPVIGVICGSENDPDKRWPIPAWRDFIQGMASARPAAQFRLFGTANDRPVVDAVAHGLAAPIENLAGRTDLAAFAERLVECRLLVTNDTGGMHLANALGVPVVALFGPTNPLRTGPVFRAPARLLQPPGCPATGGGRLAELRPAAVRVAVDEVLAAADV